MKDGYILDTGHPSVGLGAVFERGQLSPTFPLSEGFDAGVRTNPQELPLVPPWRWFPTPHGANDSSPETRSIHRAAEWQFPRVRPYAEVPLPQPKEVWSPNRATSARK